MGRWGTGVHSGPAAAWLLILPNCFKVVLIELIENRLWGGGGMREREGVVLEVTAHPPPSRSPLSCPGSQPGGSLSPDPRPSPSPLPDWELGLAGTRLRLRECPAQGQDTGNG